MIRSSNLLIAFVAIILMGLVPVLVKIVSLNEISVAIVRLTLATTGTLLTIKGLSEFKKAQKHHQFLLLLIGVCFAVHWYLYFKSIKVSTPSIAALGVSTYGIHLLILNRVFFTEAINLFSIVCVGIAVGGVVLIQSTQEAHEHLLLGLTMAIVSSFLYALLAVMHRKCAEVPTRTRALCQFGIALFCFLPFMPYGTWEFQWMDVILLLILGIFCTHIAHTLWIKTSTELPGVYTSVIYYFYVPVTMLLSYVILHETLNQQQLLGAVLVIAANIAIAINEHKKNRPPLKGQSQNHEQQRTA